MSEQESAVAAMLAAADGEIVSRVRLQKIAYLLQRLGWESGFSFEYRHYGPYSRDLETAVLDATAFDLITEEFGHRVSDGARYSIFRLKQSQKEPAEGKVIETEKYKNAIRKFRDTNVTVLELAATANWLATEEKRADWRDEITKRKGRKVEGGRLEQAVALLGELNLPPAKAVGKA